jgi:hypothetical protein
MQPSSGPSDLPFPGAHSQVTGKPLEIDGSTTPPLSVRRLLPLDASAPVRGEAGWVVSLPVRAEHVEVEKRVVVYERVLVQRGEVDDATRVEAEVRREALRVDTDG